MLRFFDLELSVNKVGDENVSSGSERTNEDDLWWYCSSLVWEIHVDVELFPSALIGSPSSSDTPSLFDLGSTAV
jgi:hypothetical protein